MAEPEAEPTVDMVAAALRADSAERATYAQVRTESLGDVLPPGCVTVERERTMADRMRGRPGQARRVTVRLGEQVMTLAVRKGQPAAEICREVRGVVLSLPPVPMHEPEEGHATALR